MTVPSSVALELGEGFDDDEVSVLVDGREVWRRSGVTTNYSVGLADVVPLPPTAAASTVEVRVRGQAGAASVDPTRANGELRLRARIDPAGSLSVGTPPEGPLF